MATGNEYNTLRDLLKAIANAIRSKVGDVGLISAQDFPANINAIIKATGNATAGQVLSGVTFSNSNGEQTGAMTNNGAISESVSPGDSYTVPAGYHNGSGTVSAVANTGTAETSHVLEGKTFYGSGATKQTGVMPQREQGTNTLSLGKDGTGIWSYIPYGYYPEYSEGKAYVYTDPSEFGNASTGNVLSGVSFTSTAGLKVGGTMTNRGAWSTTINPGGSVTIPAGYHSGGGKVSANPSSRPSVLYHNSSSTNGATSLQYSFPSRGTYRVCATACCITHNGNQTEFYTNGSISATHHTNMWSKGGGTYGGVGEAPLGTVLIFMGDITASGGKIVKILTKETQSFVTLFVERLP